MGRKQKVGQGNKDSQAVAVANSRLKVFSTISICVILAAIFLIIRFIIVRPTGNSDNLDAAPSRKATTIRITRPLDFASLDDNKVDWPTEILSDSLNRQLESLAKLLADPASINDRELASIALDTISISDLNPILDDVGFVDDQLQIERGRLHANQKTQNELSGLQSLARELKSLGRPFQDSVDSHAKFKIVQIEVTKETVSTLIRVRATGSSKNQKWQLNAHWNCRWNIADKPLLVRLEGIADSYERVSYSNDRTFFSDDTDALIGHEPSLNSQFRQDTNYWLSRIESAHGIDLLGSHGVSIADVNGDGLDDVYVCQPGGLPNRLFVADPNGIAHEKSHEFGLDFCDSTRSALFVDLDNDGDQDLALVVVDQVFIFEQNTHSKFEIRKTIPVRINPTSVLAADFDSDGLLDLYILNHDSDSNDHGILGTPIPFHDANNGGANTLLRNRGEFDFENVTKLVGLEENNQRFSLAGCWEDFDDDGDMDLYIANDFGRNNLYRNENGRFSDVASSLGVEDLSAGMSVSWGDVDNDGQQDLYVSNMFSSAGNRIAYQRDFHSDGTETSRNDFRRHARGNSLFRQSDDHSFQDVSQLWNVTMGRWAWASKFADINNDGLLDILISNGFVTNENTDDL